MVGSFCVTSVGEGGTVLQAPGTLRPTRLTQGTSCLPVGSRAWLPWPSLRRRGPRSSRPCPSALIELWLWQGDMLSSSWHPPWPPPSKSDLQSPAFGASAPPQMHCGDMPPAESSPSHLQPRKACGREPVPRSGHGCRNRLVLCEPQAHVRAGRGAQGYCQAGDSGLHLLPAPMVDLDPSSAALLLVSRLATGAAQVRASGTFRAWGCLLLPYPSCSWLASGRAKGLEVGGAALQHPRGGSTPT